MDTLITIALWIFIYIPLFFIGLALLQVLFKNWILVVLTPIFGPAVLGAYLVNHIAKSINPKPMYVGNYELDYNNLRKLWYYIVGGLFTVIAFIFYNSFLHFM